MHMYMHMYMLTHMHMHMHMPVSTPVHVHRSTLDAHMSTYSYVPIHMCGVHKQRAACHVLLHWHPSKQSIRSEKIDIRLREL